MTNEALSVPSERLAEGSGIRCEIVADREAISRHFATTMIAESRCRSPSCVNLIVATAFAGWLEPIDAREFVVESRQLCARLTRFTPKTQEEHA